MTSHFQDMHMRTVNVNCECGLGRGRPAIGKWPVLARSQFTLTLLDSLVHSLILVQGKVERRKVCTQTFWMSYASGSPVT